MPIGVRRVFAIDAALPARGKSSSKELRGEATRVVGGLERVKVLLFYDRVSHFRRRARGIGNIVDN